MGKKVLAAFQILFAATVLWGAVSIFLLFSHISVPVSGTWTLICWGTFLLGPLLQLIGSIPSLCSAAPTAFPTRLAALGSSIVTAWMLWFLFSGLSEAVETSDWSAMPILFSALALVMLSDAAAYRLV